jgi:hypothetical protein
MSTAARAGSSAGASTAATATVTCSLCGEVLPQHTSVAAILLHQSDCGATTRAASERPEAGQLELEANGGGEVLQEVRKVVDELVRAVVETASTVGSRPVSPLMSPPAQRGWNGSASNGDEELRLFCCAALTERDEQHALLLAKTEQNLADKSAELERERAVSEILKCLCFEAGLEIQVRCIHVLLYNTLLPRCICACPLPSS